MYSELQLEPFDPEEFVERLAYRCSVEDSPHEFNPVRLHDAFVQAIRELKVLQESTQQKTDRIRKIAQEEEVKHWRRVVDLLDRNKAAFSHFQELDERINFAATKVIHLGDQLESVNVPRSRAVDAEKLMNYFAEFLAPGPVISEVFTDEAQLNQAADVIHKLHLIAQELPKENERFEVARQRISKQYDKIEEALISKFTRAQHAEDRECMKEVAAILTHFKGYSQCVDAFIEESQMNIFCGKDLFSDVIPLCQKNNEIIKEVFTNADQVMAKFVLNIYHGRLQEHIKCELVEKSDSEQYLKALYDLYLRTNKLSSELSAFSMGNDSTFLSKLTKNIFHKHLESYISVEAQNVNERCALILTRYYESKNHQKKAVKQIQIGSIQDLRRNLQASLATRSNLHMGLIVDNYGGETFLSEEVAINILQETKVAFRRCQLLSKPSDLAENAITVFELLLQNLCIEHMDYALELGLQVIAPMEPKTPPDIYFLDIVRQSNAIMHLLERQFHDHLLPLVISTSKHGDCLQKKRDIMEQLEQKLDIGIERTVTAVIGWVRYFLQTEQKKSDFKPENENVDSVPTQACNKVIRFLNSCIEKIRDCLDGKNLEISLLEFGTKFHRVIFEHFQQFQFSTAGAMCVICDVNEYRKCVAELKIPLLNLLFDSLHALCNLLVVPSKNLQQVCSGNQLAGLDRTIIMNFIQLRTDYKSQRLGNKLKS